MLREFAAGDKSALDEVMPLVYAELRRVAGRQLKRETANNTVQPTALVHEAYIKMVGQDQPDYRNRSHFLAVAARVMRQILIDHARARNTDKRGGGEQNYSLDQMMEPVLERPAPILAVEEALQALEKTDSLKSKLIELRFFGGLTAEESSEVIQLPVEKVRAELRIAQAWLQRELDGAP
jgi:RNA polymerase sigma factor (TIGR02999 family)